MGKFIIIESSDAAGGSTQVALLTKRLKREGYTPHQFHFPQEDRATGQVVYGKYLRVHNEGRLSKREQALLYIQDFFSKKEEFDAILQKKKNIIVSDRYYTSTMAYQTAGTSGPTRQAMLEWIKWLVWKGEPQLPKPDVVIFIDIPVDMALERLKGSKTDHHEKRAPLMRFRRSYVRLAKEQKWQVVSAVTHTGGTKSRQAIHKEIWEIVRKKCSI